MKMIEVRAANPVAGDTEEYQQESQWLEVSLEQIHDRASTQTQILMNILDREETSYWHHGGLNE